MTDKTPAEPVDLAVEQAIRGVLLILRGLQGPPERSPRNRRLAILITKMEEVLALYHTYILNELKWE